MNENWLNTVGGGRKFAEATVPSLTRAIEELTKTVSEVNYSRFIGFRNKNILQNE